MKKSFIILFLFFIQIQFLFSQKIFYWEKEILLTNQSTGKFEAVTNGSIIVTSYATLDKENSIYVRYSNDGYIWSEAILLKRDFFSGTSLADDFSIDIDKNNSLYLCYRKDQKNFAIERLDFPFESNKPKPIINISSNNYIFLPKIKISQDNTINLLYNSSIENNFTIEYKKINFEGVILTELKIGDEFKSNMNPFFVENNETYYIAFQAKEKTVQDGYFFNIYIAISSNKGKNWSIKRVVTSQGENNQGPFILIKDNSIHLAWEKDNEKGRSQIYYKTVSNDLKVESKEILVSSNFSEAHSPSLLFIGSILHIFWYDDKNGTFQNYLAQLVNYNVFNDSIVTNRNARTLRLHILLHKDKPKIFSLERVGNQTRLALIQTDSFVTSPEIEIVNSNNLNVYNKNSITFKWKKIDDTSGIRGYRLLITKNKDEKISEKTQLLNFFETTKTYTNISDGQWFAKIVAIDNALNQSLEKMISFTIDTKAPAPPEFTNVKMDNDGYLITNSPVIEWDTSNEPISEYKYYAKHFLDNEEYKIDQLINNIKEKEFVQTKIRTLSFENLDNGILLIGVKATDLAGNTSDINWKRFRLNKYVAVTYISQITEKKERNGDSFLQIYGRGFLVDGAVTKIVVDKNKKAPFDTIIEKNDFTVISDRYIQLLKEIDMEDGFYFIGVDHPVRGYAFYNKALEFSGQWIFKDTGFNFFNFHKVFLVSDKINFTFILFLTGAIIWIILIFLIVVNLIKTLKERVTIKLMIEKLENLKKNLPESEYKKRRQAMIKKGLGLTIKYTILIISLVISIVVGTSFTLSYRALANETTALAKEMKERANIVMINYETLMKDVYIFQQGLPRAIDITENMSKLPDVGFVLFKEINSDDIYIRYGEREKVFFKKDYDNIKNDLNLKNKKISEIVFNDRIKNELESFKNSYDGVTRIYPEFNPTKIKESYLYIRPVIVKEKNRDTIYAYIVIGYSFERIIEEINSEKIKSIQIALIVTLVAILISIIGAIFLASNTIRPIKKMSKHVNVIATIDDYEKLLGTENEKIEVKTKDEIGILAFSINEMTNKLIEKAKADKQMMLGKEIQKKFIPLEPHETDLVDIFGFYEGAKGVSGDYFDFKKLDDEHYAFIICDVAGKAVPAALIMVQISTIFHSYFTNFNLKKNKIETVSIVNMINDTVAEREFSGRFAAILVIILNVKTGKAFLTNAGYTQMLIYRNNKREAEWIKLNADSGAAGVFPSYMLPNPYVQEEITVNKGDIIYLFTDGIEESRNGKTIKTENGEEKPEEFGLERIKAIVDKSHNKSPKDVIMELIDAEKVFRGEEEQYDDLTIIGIKRK